MDDLFGMLYSDLEPRKKLLTAVSNNMVDSLDKLIESGIDLDMPVQQQNGNRALHVACQHGHSACVMRMLQHRANADCRNNFGFTPIAMALRSGHSECVKIILNHGSTLSDANTVWNSQQMNDSPIWIIYSVDCLKLLISATPSISWFNDMQVDYLHNKGIELIKYFLLCGNVMSSEKMQNIVSKSEEDQVRWLKAFQRCHSLQHYARMHIRRRLRPNVFYAARKLPIPSKVQEFLVITDTMNPCV